MLVSSEISILSLYVRYLPQLMDRKYLSLLLCDKLVK